MFALMFASDSTLALAKSFAPPIDQFRGQVILVTGAGQGLGKAISLALAQAGATVVLHGRTLSKLEAVYDEIEAAGYAEPAMLPMDFANATEPELEGMALGIRKDFGKLNAMIHCAVDCPSLRPMADQKMDDLLSNYRINVAAPIALTRACLPLLKQSGAHSPSTIVFTGESHGLEPKPFWGGFALSKGALMTLSAIWPGEMSQPSAVKFTTIIPGPIASPQRFVTHPGELARNLPTMSSVVPAYLYALTNHAHHGEIFRLTSDVI